MSYTQLSVFQKPQWFMKLEGKKLDTNENVVTELKTLNGQLVVVTAIGSLRTGKSWILNRLAECEPENGFTVLDGQSSVTKGIWIFCREHPHKDNCIMVFLDTEGLNDPFKNDSSNEDNRHFIAAFLLCDALIYNVSKQFDNNDLEKVGFITQISEKLQKEEAIKIYPEFILLVRDVKELKLDNKKVKPDEYLNSILTREENSSKLSPKNYILQNFKNRRCFKMTQPADFEDLDKMHQEKVPLKENYLEDERVLKEHMIEKVDVKRSSSGSPCTVKVFCGIIPAIVKQVGEGGIPVVSSILHSVAREENERLQIEVKQRFEASLCDWSTNNSYDSFRKKATHLKDKFKQELLDNLVPEYAEQKQEFSKRFQDFADDLVEAILRKKCETEREKYLDPILDSAFTQKYQPPNGEEQFQMGIDKARTMYTENLNYFGNEEALYFWKQRENEIHNCQAILTSRDSEWKTAQKLTEQTEQLNRQQKCMEEMKQQLEREKNKTGQGRGVETAGQVVAGAFRLGAAVLDCISSFHGNHQPLNVPVPVPLPKDPSGSDTAV